MEPPEKIWEKSPLKRLAERSLEKPGMYLIALRAHLNRGQTMIGDILETVADSLPKRARLGSPEDS